MKHFVCAVFYNDDKILCCKRTEEGSLWKFPHSDKPYVLDSVALKETMTKSLKDEILSEFDFGGRIPYDLGASMDAAWVFAKHNKIKLAQKYEEKWITAEEIDKLVWQTEFVPIAEYLRQELIKKNYKITVANPDGSEEVMWAGECSHFQMENEFERIIHEQQISRHASQGTIPWRQIRVYDKDGMLIQTES